MNQTILQPHYTAHLNKESYPDNTKSVKDLFDWSKRDVSIRHGITGEIITERTGLEFPTDWTDNAAFIVADRYFRSDENSLWDCVDRIVSVYRDKATQDGYLTKQEAAILYDELCHGMISQKFSFNSPVWFNVGVKNAAQQVSACFILSVEDDMEDILNWYVREGIIFKGGSGAGINLSTLRSSKENLSGGDHKASGPVSYMRAADASAGTIKSGGRTRRAAKMVVLDVDHPDIEEFIWCKVREEKKAKVLRGAGWNLDMDGEDYFSVHYQNANNSVRVTDEFMNSVAQDAFWDLKDVTGKKTLDTVKAKGLFEDISKAAWECADPGLQFTTSITDWHTLPNSGPITASNPCGEYLHLDNTSCNLASVKLTEFMDQKTGFDTDGFVYMVKLLTIAMDVSISFADFPTDTIADRTRACRPLGIGFTDLGALLIQNGVPYDSDTGRHIAAALTSLMSSAAYDMSSTIAAYMGPHDMWHDNKVPTASVMEKHLQAHTDITESITDAMDVSTDDNRYGPWPKECWSQMLKTSQGQWHNVTQAAASTGLRNSQATAIAPTGTISFAMDADTTGIEPELSIVKEKTTAEGGKMYIMNTSVPQAMRTLGYSPDEIDKTESWIRQNGEIQLCPVLRPQHKPVFSTALGTDPISPSGHLKMMAACQPFVSGGISKTVNLPGDATAQDIELVYTEAWKLGLKAVSIYRDSTKHMQPLTALTGEKKDDAAAPQKETRPQRHSNGTPQRNRLDRRRKSVTTSYHIGGSQGYIIVGEYEDGSPGEIFAVVAKQGSTLAGFLNSTTMMMSLALQYGAPLKHLVSKLAGTKFEPSGLTDDPEIRIATSHMDFIARRLAFDYLSDEDLEEIGMDPSARTAPQDDPGVLYKKQGLPQSTESETAPAIVPVVAPDGPVCGRCGTMMVVTGSCWACQICANSTGCS